VKKKTLATMAIAGMLFTAGSAFTATAESAATPQTLATQRVGGVTVSGAPKLSDMAALKAYVASNSNSIVADVAAGDTVSVTTGN
jgi:hypothetical protein